MKSEARKKEKNVYKPASTEPEISLSKKSVSARLRKIGNSKGIILSNSILKKSCFEEGMEVIVSAEKDTITIKPAENKTKINTDLSTWEAQFKKAIQNGDKPETDVFEGLENKFDKEEW